MCKWSVNLQYSWEAVLLFLSLQRIQYAKTDSEVISKMRGTYGDKDKKKDKKKKAQDQAANANKKPAVVSVSSLHLYSALHCIAL